MPACYIPQHTLHMLSRSHAIVYSHFMTLFKIWTALCMYILYFITKVRISSTYVFISWRFFYSEKLIIIMLLSNRKLSFQGTVSREWDELTRDWLWREKTYNFTCNIEKYLLINALCVVQHCFILCNKNLAV